MTQAHTLPRFDEHGRCLPTGLNAPAHKDSRRWFLFNQPAIDYSAIHARAAAHLPHAAPLISADEFQARANALLHQIQAVPDAGHITKGIGIPFLLPQHAISDVGEALESTYVPAVSSAFKASFPAYDFVSHNTVHLGGQLGIAEGSRHDRLLAAARNGDVVGWYFPCLLEYSVPAAIEVMQYLPENFLLAGGIDTCAALVGSPDLLLRRDGYPPLIWLSALLGEKPAIGYHFEAYGYNLTFNRRAHLGQAAEYWASAIVAIA